MTKQPSDFRVGDRISLTPFRNGDLSHGMVVATVSPDGITLATRDDLDPIATWSAKVLARAWYEGGWHHWSCLSPLVHVHEGM